MSDATTSHQQIRNLIGQAYVLMNNDPKGCVRLSQKALELSREEGFAVGEGMALMHIGLGFFHQSRYSEALEFYLKAEPVLLEQSYWYGVRCLYNNLGVLHRQRDELDMALDYYRKNKDLEEKYPDPKLTANILINLSSIHLDLQELELAQEYAQEALECAEKYNLDSAMATSCLNIAVCCRRTGRLEEAHSFYSRALRTFTACGNTDGTIQCLNNQTSLFLQEQRNEEALSNLNRALDLSLITNDRYNQSRIYLSYAKVFQAKNNIEKMKSALEKCMNIAVAESWHYIVIKALSMSIELAESQRDWKRTLDFTRQRQEHIDILNDARRNRDIQEIRTKLLVQKREHEAEILRLRTEELRQRIEEEVQKREQQQRIILQKSRMESLGRLAAGIAHEINQPLGMLNIGMQNLFNKIDQGQPSVEYIQKKKQTIEGHIQRIRKIIEHIRLFSRDRPKKEVGLFDVREVVQSALSMIGVQYREHNIQVDSDLGEIPLKCTGDPYRLEQVILNLLANARDALDEKFDSYDDRKRILIKTLNADQSILLEIADNGCGIPESALPAVFDPFYTTKDETCGTGLGLSICFGIVTEMGGTIDCRSQPGAGTTFLVTLPLLLQCQNI